MHAVQNNIPLLQYMEVLVLNMYIRCWREDDADDFLKLSLDWLKKYELLEPADLKILYNPHEVILDRGGMIFFAETDHKTVGTVSVIPLNDGIFEMAKLTVSETYRRLHIGEALVKTAIQFAENKSAKKLVLFTNSRLIPAIHLYHKCGFKEIPHTDSEYEVSDKKLELKL